MKVMFENYKKEDHPNYRSGKGCVVAFHGKCTFLGPKDTYTDPKGRKYFVDENGSIRRVKENV